MSPRDRSQDAELAHRGVVIVKGRRAAADDGHHGGGWKIAYADFMTAMMAFFLVMWLVNSTDEKTIVQVAAYFNPIRLSEKSPSQKGMHDGNLATNAGGSKEKAATAGGDPKVKVAQESNPVRPKRKQEEPSRVEAKLFLMPDEVLGEIAARAPAEYVQRSTKELLPARTDHPKDPWLPQLPQKMEAKRPSKPPPNSTGSDVDALAKRATSESAADATRDRAAEAVEAQVASAVADLMGRIRGRQPSVNVQSINEGLLISVTDNQNFGMFSIASAEPRPELVVLLEEIGKILSEREGSIVLRGHTDGRPYRTQAYDNWRLSTSRAHAARFMLARGGVAEHRFEKIEGHADRTPRNRDDRDAAENRRIDILLRSPK